MTEAGLGIPYRSVAEQAQSRRMEMYAITGITGKVGGEVARCLLAAGAPVRAVVRDAAKGAAWAALGCEVALAEMENAEQLAAAFAGAE
jgi:NAD(P)H dehydrogenase (quinone)